MATIVSMYAMAGSDLKVVNGNKKFIKENRGNAILEFNYDDATYDGKEPLTNKFPDIENLKKLSWDGFVEEFNDRCKTVKVVRGEKDAQYKILIKITKIDQIFNVMGIIPGHCIRAWGTVTITDIKTNGTMLTLEIDEIDGGANPSPDGAYSDCFEELGKQMSKLN